MPLAETTTERIPAVVSNDSYGTAWAVSNKVPTQNKVYAVIAPIAAVTTATQSANTFFAGPTSGPAAAPTFRVMVTADIPNSVVTLAKIANIADQTILGNNAGSAGPPIALTASQTRTVLGLGSMALQNATSVSITGGTLSNVDVQTTTTGLGLKTHNLGGFGTFLYVRNNDNGGGDVNLDFHPHGADRTIDLSGNLTVSSGGATVSGTHSGTSSGTNTGDVTLAGTPNYITISGQVITRSLIDLTTHVTGALPGANINYNTTNLKVTSTALNTIQDIATTSTGVTFGSLGIGTGLSLTSSQIFQINKSGTADIAFLVGDDAHSSSNNLAGFYFDRYTDGSFYIDTKTYSGGQLLWRIGQGTEVGYTRSWLRVLASDASVTIYGTATFANSITFSSSSSMIDHSSNTGVREYFYNGGAGTRYGVGINSNEMQIFGPSSGSNHISISKGGDLQTSGTNEVARFDLINSRFGVGTTSPASTLHLTSTTEQFRAGYDASNAIKVTVGPTGITTIDGLGSAKAVKFASGMGLGVFGATPSAQSTGWSITNYTVNKTFDGSTISYGDLMNFIATFVDEMKTKGWIGA